MRNGSLLSILLVGVCSSVSVVAAEVPAERALVPTTPAASRKQAETEIAEYIAKLGKVASESSVLSMVPLVDAQQTAELLAAQIKDKDLGKSIKSLLRNRLTGQMAVGIMQANSDWERHVNSRLVVANSLDLATVTVRTWDRDGYSNRVQYWLIRRSDGWKSYDFNDLSLGIRTTQIVLIVFGQAIAEGSSMTRQELNLLKTAVFSLQAEDFDRADEQLRLIEDRKFPPLVEAIKWTVIAITAAAQEDHERVLDSLDRCDKLGHPFPIGDYVRAFALNELERPEEALAAVERFDKSLGEDAQSLYERGRALQSLDRDDEALTAFRRGLDDTPDLTENLIGLGLLLAPENKQEIVTRFAVLRRPAERFEEIAVEYVDAVDAVALQTLVDAMAKIDANNLDVAYYGAEAALMRDEPAAAAALLGKALKRTIDEDQRPFYFERFLDASLAAEQVVAGYRQVSEKQDAFEYMAIEMTGEDRDDELLALINEHSREFPNDPLTWYFTGEMHFYSDEFDKADQAYSKAATLKPSEYYLEDIRTSRVYCWYHQDKGSEAYGQLKPDSEVFDQLAELYFVDDRVEELRTLVDHHESAHGSSVEIVFWRGQVLWQLKEYASFVQLIQPKFDQIIAEFDESDNWETGLKLLRSLQRLGRIDESLKMAKRINKIHGDPFPVLLASAALGDMDQSLTQLELAYDEWDWYAYELLNDEDLNRALQKEEAAPLRARLVRHFVDENRDTSLVLLLKEPVEISVDQLQAAVKRAWNIELTQIDPDQVLKSESTRRIVDYETGWFDVKNEDHEFSIEVSTDPRCRFPETVAKEIRELRRHTLYGQHRAFVMIRLDTEEPDSQAWRLAARLIAELAADMKPLLLEAPEGSHLALWDESLKQELMGDDPLAAIRKVRMVPVIRIDDDSPAMRKAIQTARERWSEFTDAFEKKQKGQSFSVKATFTDGKHKEAMWIKVASITDGEVAGTLDSEPVQVSTIKQGESTSVPASKVLDWLFTSADGKSLTGLFSRDALQAVEQE